MVILRTLEVLFVIGGIVASGIAAHLWLRAQKYRATAEAKDEVIKLMADTSDAWKLRYEAEHGEYKKYQTETHQRNEETNARLLALVAENTDLHAKTDLSPVRQFIEEQNTFNEKFLQALNAIVDRLENGPPKRRKRNSGISA